MHWTIPLFLPPCPLVTTTQPVNIWLYDMLESSSSSQGISLKGWVVLVGNDVAFDSRYGTTCLFQASGSLLYLFKSIRSEVWHFQFPLTQIIFSLLPFKQSSCFSDSLRIMFTCDYIVQFSSVQSLSHVQLFETPWITARQASLSITNSGSSLRLMSIESVMITNIDMII